MLNVNLILAVNDVTLEHAQSGIKSRIDYFRVFGYIFHVYVPDAKRVKLDGKSLKYVLLGINEKLKAFWLYDPTSKKVIVNKNIIFEEDVNQNWGMIGEEIKQDVLEQGDIEE